MTQKRPTLGQKATNILSSKRTLKQIMDIVNLLVNQPGSSKWPHLDPWVTVSGLKWPPFRESKTVTVKKLQWADGFTSFPEVEKLLVEMCQAQLCPDLPLLVAHAECQVRVWSTKSNEQLNNQNNRKVSTARKHKSLRRPVLDSIPNPQSQPSQQAGRASEKNAPHRFGCPN